MWSFSCLSLCCWRYSVTSVFNAPSGLRNYILVSLAPESAAAHTLMELPWHRVIFSVCLLAKSSGREQTFVWGLLCPWNLLCVCPKALCSVFTGRHWPLCVEARYAGPAVKSKGLPSACYVILLMPSAFIRSQERVNRITGSGKKKLKISILVSGFFYFENC